MSLPVNPECAAFSFSAVMTKSSKSVSGMQCAKRNLQARDKGASGHSPREKMLIVRAVACEKISASVSEGIHCRGSSVSSAVIPSVASHWRSQMKHITMSKPGSPSPCSKVAEVSVAGARVKRYIVASVRLGERVGASAQRSVVGRLALALEDFLETVVPEGAKWRMCQATVDKYGDPGIKSRLELSIVGKNAEPLKKAIKIYLDHEGLVDSWRASRSRCGLVRHIVTDGEFVGTQPINFVAVQCRWAVEYEDVSAAFLEGKALPLPRKEKIYVKVPRGYPEEVVEFLVEGLGRDCRDDLVELTKAGFGLLESPRLWYLEYKAFHPQLPIDVDYGECTVDDTRVAGDEAAGELWEKLRARLKFGQHRKARGLKFDNIAGLKFTGNFPTDIHTIGDDIDVRRGPRVRHMEYLQQRVVHTEADEPLSEGEKKVISSLTDQLNWAAREGRYDLAYVAPLDCRDALRWLNLRIKRAQESLYFKVRNLGCALEDVIVVSASDAAYGAMPGGHSQGANLVMLAHPKVLSGVGPVCILEVNSTKIHRVVRCSMSAEISALTLRAGNPCRVDRSSFRAFELGSWKRHVAKWRHVLATDAKTHLQ
ncbi:unnamed protein product [Symbiodinium microadriaticum]|nr:unnamed protein product [Symbiodinium microadriaticum]